MADELAARRGPWLRELHLTLNAGLSEGSYPGASCAVFHQGRLVHASATGQATILPAPVPTSPETAYDLASLTKVLATTLLLGVLAGRGEVGLDDPVIRYLPAFGRSGGKQRLTIADLLAHRSGLPAWRPFFALAQQDPGSQAIYRGVRQPAPVSRARSLVAQAALIEPLAREPGSAAVYSDVGFIVLGLLLEAVGGARLDALAEAQLYRPLGLRSLHFRPLDARRLPDLRLAATGLRRPREPALGQEKLFTAGEVEAPRAGEVDDDNAFAQGGVSGHAGLFGTALDVARLGALLFEDFSGAAHLAPRHVWERIAQRDTSTPGSTRALGFDTPSETDASCGPRFGRGPNGAIGHLGFTGCSLWIDRDRTLVVALLTNRVHPDRALEGIRAFRPRFHEAVLGVLEGQATSPT
jgi:CubicO group peptidase (beta-lactamase class C family)